MSTTSLKLIPLDQLEEVKGLTNADRETVREVLSNIAGAANAIRRAAESWVGLSTKVREKVIEGLAPTWRTFLRRLELVGEHKLHPQLYPQVGRASRLLARLSYEQQEEFLRERIPVLLHVRGTSRLMDVEDLSKEQTAQVFRREGDTAIVRTLEMQKAYLEELDRRRKLAEERDAGNLKVINRPGRWKVMGPRAVIDPEKAKTGFTQRDAALLLKDLASE